jgi:hypothetical protein
MEKRCREKLREEMNPESGRFSLEPTAYSKGGEVYELLQKQGEAAVHEWINGGKKKWKRVNY